MVLFFDSLFQAPRAFHPTPSLQPAFALFATDASTFDNSTISNVFGGGVGATDGMGRITGAEHPPLGYLMLLVFEAVLEVVCVSLPGYIIAKQGMFNTEMQKFVANLNVSLFTPCLIFTKLASQLTLSKIAELAVIPVLFVIMTLVSLGCAMAVCKVFKFGKRARNFVIAMGVFGNSNSLPISLVVSLSMTISGLHWDRIPGDNDEDVAARGILYLLIFQQLGQLVRWSWGYHVLLAPPKENDESDDGTPAVPTVGVQRYRDDPEDTDSDIESLRGVDPFQNPQFANSYQGLHQAGNEHEPLIKFANSNGVNGTRYHNKRGTAYSSTNNSEYPSAAPSGNQTPITPFPAGSSTSSISSRPSSAGRLAPPHAPHAPQDYANPTPTNGNITSFPSIARNGNGTINPPTPSTKSNLPPTLAKIWTPTRNFFIKVYTTFMAVMNPPLWAMLLAVIVASVPKLQHLFFTPGTFVQNSVTRAVSQSGNVAVPLILVVLGANLAGNTTGKEDLTKSPAKSRHETKLLFASLLSRMVLPYLVMAPLLALAAKHVPISILDDPIFVIVCFLLIGAPSALQLAQICQINGVYENVMARILFWSYVVVILPSTLVLVITAIEVVQWAM